jgi:hypothetical protein
MSRSSPRVVAVDPEADHHTQETDEGLAHSRILTLGGLPGSERGDATSARRPIQGAPLLVMSERALDFPTASALVRLRMHAAAPPTPPMLGVI